MVSVREVIVVEGKYDKNALAQLVDATILETRGFGVFKDREMQSYLRRAAEKRGIVVLTDSDGAGFVIRNFLKGILPKDQVKHAYIPDVSGKERRKAAPGKEGKLGVEGMRPEVLLEALRRAGATILDADCPISAGEITKADLARIGLSGGKDSSRKRQLLLKRLNLPAGMSANAMLQALNLLYTPAELEEIAGDLKSEQTATGAELRLREGLYEREMRKMEKKHG